MLKCAREKVRFSGMYSIRSASMTHTGGYKFCGHKKKSNTNSPQAAQAANRNAKWYKADLHLHTPASRDYEKPGVTYLEWLRKVVDQGLDIVAATDHNTVAPSAGTDWLPSAGELTGDPIRETRVAFPG